MSRRCSILVAPLAAFALAAGGCGRERIQPPDPARPATALAPAEQNFPAVGLRFRAPRDLIFEPGQAPLVTSTASGSLTVAVWRYPRAETLPRSAPSLRDARRRLVDAVRRRDGTFRLDRARRLEVDGAPALQVLGTQRVAGRERRVRSTHVYAKGAEVVVDAFSAPRDFAVVDERLFRPLVKSLKIDPPAGG